MKIMGIDLGQARTGVCVSDLSGFLAGRSITIAEHNRERRMEAVLKEIEAERPGRIVVGLPLNMNGTEGPKALECREFAAQLEEQGRPLGRAGQQRHRQSNPQRCGEKTGQAAGPGGCGGGPDHFAGLSGLASAAPGARGKNRIKRRA